MRCRVEKSKPAKPRTLGDRRYDITSGRLAKSHVRILRKHRLLDELDLGLLDLGGEA